MQILGGQVQRERVIEWLIERGGGKRGEREGEREPEERALSSRRKGTLVTKKGNVGNGRELL